MHVGRPHWKQVERAGRAHRWHIAATAMGGACPGGLVKRVGPVLAGRQGDRSSPSVAARSATALCLWIDSSLSLLTLTRTSSGRSL